MKTPAVNTQTVDLGYEQLFLLDSGPGTRVRVLHGAMWLTEEGEPGDTIVRAGGERTLRGRGATLLEGLEPARVQVVTSAAFMGLKGRAWRLARRIVRAGRDLTERLQLGARHCAGPAA